MHRIPQFANHANQHNQTNHLLLPAQVSKANRQKDYASEKNKDRGTTRSDGAEVSATTAAATHSAANDSTGTATNAAVPAANDSTGTASNAVVPAATTNSANGSTGTATANLELSTVWTTAADAAYNEQVNATGTL